MKTLHHVALTRGHISVKETEGVKETYNGRFGCGYTIKRNNPNSTRYCFIEYYVEGGKNMVEVTKYTLQSIFKLNSDHYRQHEIDDLIKGGYVIEEQGYYVIPANKVWIVRVVEISGFFYNTVILKDSKCELIVVL